MALAKSRWIADHGERGFSLLEVMIAAAIMVAGAASLAQLFVMSTRTNVNAKSTSMATLLAKQKVEQLRALQWGFDALGLPINDTTTNTAAVPETAVGGTGLSPSPAGTLNQNVVGWVDYLDPYGVSLGGATTTVPAHGIYIRRWSVEPLPTNPNNTLILQVLVTVVGNRNAVDTTTSVSRNNSEARMITVKTRKAS
jgi:prepilin-type N-terminal cleavage/methylation domain-containing protein